MSTKKEEVAEEAIQVLQEELEKMKEKVSKLTSSATETLANSKEKVVSQIKDRPLASLAIAAGVGVLAGLLIKK
jgi:ElaB/YqjD/DUF883 family membrane-anchored ribosome-binding protein